MTSAQVAMSLRMHDLQPLITLSPPDSGSTLNEQSVGYVPDFPGPIYPSPGAVGWCYREVRDWLENRPRSRA